ncbi:MAG: hypothetical protein ABL859_00885, partial [Methylotenera sp.]
IFRLTGKNALQKELSLPAAAKENLYQVITYELSRYSPFSAEQAYYAVKVLDTVNEPGQIRVILIITARDVLDAFYTDLKAFDMTPKLVDYEGVPTDLDQNHGDYNLLPEWLQVKTDKTAQIIHASLLGGLFTLLIGALALPVWFESRSVNALQEKISSIEKEP